MASTIQIKRTVTNGQPDELQYGELAYSGTAYSSNTGGDKLYIGTTPYANGLAQVIQPIGGKFYVDKLDHSPGTLTSNSAILVDADSKIDILKVDNLVIDDGTLTVNSTSGAITVTAGSSSGNIALVAGTTGDISITGGATGGNVDITAGGTVNIEGDVSISNATTITLGDLIVGNTTITAASNTDITIAPVDTAKLVIDATTQITIPSGTTLQRDTGAAGDIRFNTELNSYEGYNGSAWTSLGGVIDVDQDTLIKAESSSGADEDTLYFYTGNATNPLMTINSTAMTLTSNSTFNPLLSVGDIQIQNNVISGGDSHSNELIINPDPASNAGVLTVMGDLQVWGNTTTIASTVTTVEDPIMTLGGNSAPESNDSKDRGIEFNYHNGVEAKVGFFGYDESADEFTFIEDANNASEVFDGVAGAARFGALKLEGQISEYDGNTTINNGELLIGGTGGFLKGGLTAGQAITITTGDGSLTFDIDDATAVATANVDSDLNPASNNYSAVGVASFASEQFTVTSGHVYLSSLDGGEY
jgi:hypothetical protein